MASAVDSLPIVGNHPQAEVRSCDTTSLPVCLTAQQFIRWHAVVAVVFLLIGGIGALLLALTRWPTVHLLDAQWYYRILTLHGLNMLIFWMLQFEIAVLYFAATVLLNTRQTHARLLKASRVFSNTVAAKYNTAISKLRIQKISMLRPWSVSRR